jgi:serine protease Do
MRARVVGAWLLATGLAWPVAAGETAKPCCLKHVSELAHAGRASGHLGIALQEIPADELGKQELDAQGGARVVRVEPGSPAGKAGIQDGDVIVRFNGEPAVSARKLARMVHEIPPGRRVKVDLRRGAEMKSLEITVGEGAAATECLGDHVREALAHLPSMPRIKEVVRREFPRRSDFELFLGRGPRRLGIEYQEISGQLARYFHLDSERGLLVTEVEAGSAAERAGLKAGDVLLAFGGQAVDDGMELRREIQRVENGEVAVKVLRDGKPLELKVVLARPPARSESAI